MLDIKIENCKLLPTHLWSRECFACGVNNSCGLHMKFYSAGKYLISKLNLDEKFKGWDLLVHGGIISTILDEMMAWALIQTTRNIMLTKSMTVNYHNKLIINTDVRVFAWVEEVKDRVACLKAELYDEKNNLCASANGEYVLFSVKLAKKLHLMSDESIAEFENFLTVCP